MNHVEPTTKNSPTESKPYGEIAERLAGESLAGAKQSRRILVLSGAFPSRAFPTYGVFVKERVKAIASLPGYEVRVIAPVPYFPPIKRFKRWYVWSQFPNEEIVDGLPVIRPRYVLPPKLGGYFEADLMYPAARRAADRIRKEFDFDLIDAHFVFPNGVAAVRLGKRFGVPVVMTGRGEDMLRFPEHPVKGRRIRRAIQHAAHCIALSREIAGAFENNGAHPDRISVIPNGVDTEQFRPLPMHEARKTLNLPRHAKIILSVGDRLELKGFHLLVEALPAIRQQHRGARLIIVGGPGRHGRDYTAEIQRRIDDLDLHDCVLLADRRPHEELPCWYNAADVFALLSSREGSPNVLLEALACGTPAVATAVGGISDELADERLGILLSERSVPAAAAGVIQALNREWDRNAIRQVMETRSWRSVASQVSSVFDESLHTRSPGCPQPV